MNYLEWAEEYLENARRILAVIEKKKALMNDRTLSRDARKAISDTITEYRCIHRELLETAAKLRERAGESRHAA